MAKIGYRWPSMEDPIHGPIPGVDETGLQEIQSEMG